MTEPANDRPVSVALGLGGLLRIGGRAVAVADVLTLLNAIQATGSVQGVATELELSYRAAWDRLRNLEAALGHQLVQKTRGHGSALTPFGLSLRQVLGDATAGLAAALAREGRAVEASLTALFTETPRRLALAASHDLLLMEVVEALGEGEVAVVGSKEAVQRLLDGRADVAGFHLGAEPLSASGPPFAELADNPGLRVLPLFEREQGLMLAAGNPLGIRAFPDLAGRRARYVNRQKGSGTRLWFDRLLAEHAIPAAEVQGYGVEEFTHQAVAAVIATGTADAGLGARSAAERFGLHFLSIGWETYYLAASATLPTEALDRLVSAVAARAERSPGYKAPPRS
ncbi:substrate-binding domain-containing protein [Methylobacterium planeticum]|uniref:Helix-turn-helix transcriptional regulator n=1 Tax=Methylobacterium planeticum TaxID=2615211 RepID=A0A6N6MKM3_9HYPH|nr:substrate-binding domain-containing protein [Methylobacterium planeticum]KAB1070212.1 helix-turn-helix transcriptional regulator [Methylobacterium planeticum]